MQVGDSNYKHTNGMTSAQVQQEAPFFDAVWGSFMPSVWDSTHSGMFVSRYVFPNTDIILLSGHDLTWFQTNHPDWILYACQADGTPTHELAYFGTGFGDVPLDIHNPDVIAYQLNLLGADMVNSGYNALAADNVVFGISSTGPNPYFGEGSPQPGWYGCGIWQGNTFVRRYSGGNGAQDPNWIADMENWVATVKNYLTTNPAIAPHNFKLIVNHTPHDLTPNANEMQMLQHVDGLLDEDGFTDYGKIMTGSNFQGTMNWMEYLQAHNVAMFITDYYCSGSTCSRDVQSLTPSQVDWTLSTYAIGNNGGAGVYISPATGGVYSYRSEYSKRYGAPCGGFQTSGTLYFRKFSNGFAVANSSGTTAQSMPLPAGHVYSDIEGRPVSSPLMVNAKDGYLLLTSGNGCS
jgi:hypothetical protein